MSEIPLAQSSDQDRFETALTCLCDVVCSTLQRVALMSGVEHSIVNTSHLQPYLSFLTIAAEYGCGNPKISENLCRAFSKCELIQSLLKFAQLSEDQAQKNKLLESTMGFLYLLGAVSDEFLREYFSANVLVFLELTKFMVATDESRREGSLGYCMKTYVDFLSCCLQLTSASKEKDTLNSFLWLVNAVLDSYGEELSKPLKRCLAVEFGFQTPDKKRCSLSLPLIQQVQSVLSVLSCVSSHHSFKDEKQQSRLLVFDSIIRSILPIFSTYLVASGSAREIFALCDHADSAGSMSIDAPTYSNLDNLKRLAAAGTQNAKQ